MLKAIAISLVVGGFGTSFAEYFLKYNLIDLIKDKIVGLYQKVAGKAEAVKKAL